VDVHVLQGEREMAAYNKTLGRFQLSGIMPAPRGVPQIEVTFDIDANGIVNVSAKDMGTGAEQKITITASSNLSEADIQKAVKDAEEFAAQDKKAKESVEVKNNADAMVYQSEKLIKDMGDKLEADDKANVEAEIQKVKDAISGGDTDTIKNATENLTQAFYKISEKIYKQNPGANPGAGPEGFNGQPGGNGGNGGNGGSGPDGNVYDGDYKVVDDN